MKYSCAAAGASGDDGGDGREGGAMLLAETGICSVAETDVGEKGLVLVGCVAGGGEGTKGLAGGTKGMSARRPRGVAERRRCCLLVLSNAARRRDRPPR